MENEKVILIFKALSNGVRLNILEMLKEPDENFQPQVKLQESDDFEGGICVRDIQNKTGLVQSTTSEYLMLLQESGLLEKKRIGQWTYYRRNEETIKELEAFIGYSL